VYGTSAKGAEEFKERLTTYLREIEAQPLHPDNPVLDQIGETLTRQTSELGQEVRELASELETLLRKGPPEKKRSASKGETTGERLERILQLRNAERRFSFSASLRRREGDKEIDYHLPATQGNFNLYFLLRRGKIEGVWYISAPSEAADLESELADVRVLMQRCSLGSGIECTYIMVTQDDLSARKEAALASFEAMKKLIGPRYRKLLHLEIWDRDALLQKEIELGIRIPKS
jgi:hypothetical protein